MKKMVEAGSFERLASAVGDSGRKQGEQSLTSHYRKGIVGDWKNYMTPEQAESVNNVLSDLEKKVFKKYGVI